MVDSPAESRARQSSALPKFEVGIAGGSDLPDHRTKSLESRPAPIPQRLRPVGILIEFPAMCLLRVEGLGKSFGAVRAVDNVSFAVHAGELYGLLGPNGAGKTTILSIIAGLLRPETGTVAVEGVPLEADPQRAKRLMGVVPQELAVYEELSARENFEFWGRLAGLRTREARRRATELIEALALTERAHEPVKTYSGGMKRRVNLGCALLHRPRLLLLDEPTVGIDPQARVNLLDFLRGLQREGTAILYTTHYLEEAESLCQRIGILDHGRLLAEGTLGELQNRLGGDRVFVLEGNLGDTAPEAWPGFAGRFRVLQRTPRQLVVATRDAHDPAECLRQLLALPVPLENVTFKRPSLNEVFLELTGRELRE